MSDIDEMSELDEYIMPPQMPDPNKRSDPWLAEPKLTLSELQQAHAKWVEHNFPDQEAWAALLGIGEEVGELNHAFLKAHQGIRGVDEEKRQALIRDALGDLLVYAMHFSSSMGLDLEACLRETLTEVWKRDWRNYPEKGRYISGGLKKPKPEDSHSAKVRGGLSDE